MKKIIMMVIMIVSSVLIVACANYVDEKSDVKIINPASKFCIENGGTLEIRTAGDGSQTGYCTIGANTCEEWSLMRGECTEMHVCTVEEKANEACTREYIPVCGSDDVTYGNKCGACSAGVDSWTIGECALNYDVTEVLDEGCVLDDDCTTPTDYLIRSNCPYTTKCLEEKCTVVCPIFDGTKYPKVRECGECPQIMPPSPTFCTDGNIISGLTDECGCQAPPRCETDENTPLEMHECTAEQKAAQICTMEYMPVCGTDGVTYGNKCGACSAGVDSWYEGECK